MADVPSRQQRDAVLQISPPWLSTGTGEKFMYNIGLASDALLEKLSQAIYARMPTYTPVSGLPLLGDDRVLLQGPAESNDNFRTRLTEAFDTWAIAGTKKAVLGQILNYLSNYRVASVTQEPIGMIVSNNSSAMLGGALTNWSTYYNTSDLEEEAPAYAPISPQNWSWKTGVTQWWEDWMVLAFAPTSTLATASTFGGGAVYGQTDISWGLNCAPDVWNAVRMLLRTWKMGNAWYSWIIVSFNSGDGTSAYEFTPNGVAGTSNPGGDWYRWSKVVNGVRVASRSSNARYVAGSGVYYKNCSIPL